MKRFKNTLGYIRCARDMVKEFKNKDLNKNVFRKSKKITYKNAFKACKAHNEAIHNEATRSTLSENIRRKIMEEFKEEQNQYKAKKNAKSNKAKAEKAERENI